MTYFQRVKVVDDVKYKSALLIKCYLIS